MSGLSTILIVDDGPGDRRLLQEALGEALPLCKVAAVASGEAALEYLTQCGSLYPSLIFLDLNMPGMSGRELLRRIKLNAELSHIPVVVLTTSEDPGDILYCYQSHANSVLTKPMSMDDFYSTIATIVGYWFDTVQMPALLR